MKLERTKNSLRNILWGLINRIVNIILPFVIRSVFIYTLGVEYLGLNSLFTSILTVLNLAELGFSNAIVYNMYKPIAENDDVTICALMNYYKKVYHVIGIVVLGAGVAIIPFLDYLIKGDVPSDINLVCLYLLYLINTSVSYFLFAYKNCILTAYQREDVISKINITLKLILYMAQFAVLIYWKNYYVYVILMIINTVVTNIVTAICSNLLYPQYQCAGNITDDKKAVIKKNIQGLMIGKICLISRNAFDSIFLSMFLGLRVVTIYGNYYYIMSALSGVLLIITSSMGAGIGNSIATESIEKNYMDYMKFSFMYSWISGWCAICLLCLYQPFMELWMGKSLLFPFLDVVLMCLYFYTSTMGDVRSQYSTATGLFWENRIYVMVEAFLNIVLNYFLGKYFGVHGIILATWISMFFINFCWGARIIFRYYFVGYSVISYYKLQVGFMVLASFAAAVTYFVCEMISVPPIVELLYRGGICVVVPNLLFWIISHKSIWYKKSYEFVIKNTRIRDRVGG